MIAIRCPTTQTTTLTHHLNLKLLHTRTLQRHIDNITTTTTTTPPPAFIITNPILSLLEHCKSHSQLTQIQAQMTTTSLITDPLALSRIVSYCALSQTPNLDYLKRVLFSFNNVNVFSWNIGIKGFLCNGEVEECVGLYKEMLRKNGSRPDWYTFPLMFKVCGVLRGTGTGFGVVGHVLKMGFGGDVFVFNGLVSMLVVFGEVDWARRVFEGSVVRDLVSWNCLIGGFVKEGRVEEAVGLYWEMRGEGVKPDEVTMIAMVSLCGRIGDLKLGREFCRVVEEKGLRMTVPLANAIMDMYVKCGDVEAAEVVFDSMPKKTVVSWTTMVVGYAKCGFLDVARKIFDEMPEKDVVPWNAIIGSYVQARRSKEALDLFHEMQACNVRPDEVTMVNCLSACSQLGALDVGVWIHQYIKKHKLYLNVALGTALVDMYAKCGNITKALQVFEDMPSRNSLTWTAIIGGLALHGNAKDAIFHFSNMIEAGLVPDEVTYLGVLTACCHGGLVEEGRKYFAQMRSEFSISPRRKHYSCMVDLLGRAGLLEEAEELIKDMPIEADAVVWGALFFACRTHGNVKMGERAAIKLLELDPEDSGIYVLLANMYVEANMWEEARNVRKIMSQRGVEKTPGCSSIEVDGTVHEFIVRDKSHPLSQQIWGCLLQLTKQMEVLECVKDIQLLAVK